LRAIETKGKVISVLIVALVFAIMHRDLLEPLMAGNRTDKEDEKPAGFWCKNAFPVASMRGFFQVKETHKRLFKSKPQSVRRRLARNR
jgi:hypothetical protein